MGDSWPAYLHDIRHPVASEESVKYNVVAAVRTCASETLLTC